MAIRVKRQAELFLAMLMVVGCRDATEITVVVKNDFDCEQMKYQGAAIAVGTLNNYKSRPVTATSGSACVPLKAREGTFSNFLGSLVLSPTDDKHAEVAFEVAGAWDTRDVTTPISAEDCIGEKAKGLLLSGNHCVEGENGKFDCNTDPNHSFGCIWASGSLRFRPHANQVVPVRLRFDCANILCTLAGTTCVNSNCVSEAEARVVNQQEDTDPISWGGAGGGAGNSRGGTTGDSGTSGAGGADVPPGGSGGIGSSGSTVLGGAPSSGGTLATPGGGTGSHPVVGGGGTGGSPYPPVGGGNTGSVGNSGGSGAVEPEGGAAGQASGGVGTLAGGTGGMLTGSGGDSGGPGGGGRNNSDPTGRPSCAGDLRCGLNESCCLAPPVPATTSSFPMGRSIAGADAFTDGAPSELPEHTATVGAFRLDKFEVTVGRFQAFANAFDIWHGAGNPQVGDGKTPYDSTTGWQSEWATDLPANSNEMIGWMRDLCSFPNFDDATSARNQLPINCISRSMAFAFCVWDGSRLPTEAEWEYAASGGTKNLLYPWGILAPDSTLAAWSNTSGASPKTPVGSFTAGNGLWLHADLAGSLSEWVMDRFAGYAKPATLCDNCVNLLPATAPWVIRGGNYLSGPAELRAAARQSSVSAGTSIGFRCLVDQ